MIQGHYNNEVGLIQEFLKLDIMTSQRLLPYL